ncbi:uncharacterized protein LOC128203721 isoform X2 [Mya arenaria]|uniref:uncharacterized protein LOC128203721 isoform X2 n=1 Tax=Mya arenaria TaxID=6604 RepID=UPI0022E29A62|nr:uncharacterized protein LOC128203721 isoform X2 [Mya arenaria]
MASQYEEKSVMLNSKDEEQAEESFHVKKHSFGEIQETSLRGEERGKNVRRSQSLQVLALENIMMEDTLDEGFLIGRRQRSLDNLYSRKSRSMVRITEVVSPYKMLFSSGSRADVTENWKTPVKVFSDKRRGKPKEDKKLSRRIRSYYKDQDELIKAFEEIQLDAIRFEEQEDLDKQLQKTAELLAKLSFGLNLLLLIAKAVAVGLSGSISIISSLVDSIMDLASGIIIWWTSKAMKKKNIYLYPGGRSRLEPIAIVILSVIMSLASFQLIVESVQLFIGFAKNEGQTPSMGIPTILIASGTVVTKFILYLLCYCLGRKSMSVRTLAQDHRNDVLSNIVAVICSYLGSKEFIGIVEEENVKYIDPIGAVLISMYILVNWWRTGYAQSHVMAPVRYASAALLVNCVLALAEYTSILSLL